MISIGEKIREARRNAGMTQDALAEAMQVTRSAISNWEQGRRLPDYRSLQQLSKILNSDLTIGFQEAEKENVESMENPGETVDESGADQLSPADESDSLETESEKTITEAEKKSAPDEQIVSEPDQSLEIKRKNRKKISMLAGISAACVLLLAVLFIMPNALGGKKRGNPYTSQDGKVYTIEDFQKKADKQEGQAYLYVKPVLTVSPGDKQDYWLCNFEYQEKNGIPVTINRLEMVYFSKSKKNMEMIMSAEDLQAAGLTTEIPAYGEWSYMSGLPVQDTVWGMGELLRCTDEKGNSLTFTGYIPLNAE